MEVASKLKENYMVLLPETIPFLAELMEGEDTHAHTHALGSDQLARKQKNFKYCGGFRCCVRVSELHLHGTVVFVCVPDECEEVEQQVQKVVQEMENILGEPLQSYF